MGSIPITRSLSLNFPQEPILPASDILVELVMGELSLGLTFEDVLLVPQESNISPADVSLETQLTKNIRLRLPLLSAAMDTVTENAMAIALGKEGGIGVLHRNCTTEKQAAMVRKVKREHVLVGAAIGPHDILRAKALHKAGADVLFIDCAHAHKPSILKDAKKIKKEIAAQLVIGNIATPSAARFFLPVADALKVGIGPGSICTTRVVSGVGVPQLTAIMEIAKVAKKANIPVIGDGGIRSSGDVVKALAGGAQNVMLGSLLAGTKQAPGKIITIQGKKFKAYRGMGSLGVLNNGKSTDRYGHKETGKFMPEGVEALTPFKGNAADVVSEIMGGVKSGMGYVGAKDIAALQKKAKFVRITEAGKIESRPHSVILKFP